MRGIDRNVIKWLDSLDTGISYSHPKRDFANGYIIAVIFSHYYPGQLQPWTLYTGNSEQQKQNNWVINTDSDVFEKNKIVIPKLAIEAVMNVKHLSEPEAPEIARVVLEAHQAFLKELRKQRKQEIKQIIKHQQSQQKEMKIPNNGVQQIKVKQF
ncbi:spermatogenesis-associated protein 4 [Terramyces sp. JEL0728]|nr:spermatogenesis-associated protein 4 [Terramyces sp. JEL0728]